MDPQRRKAATQDSYHESCSHGPLPVGQTMVIEFYLTGKQKPSIVCLEQVVIDQELHTARVYLCASSRDAQHVFQALGMTASAKHVQKVNNSRGTKRIFDEEFQTDGRQILVPYDPRQLRKWMALPTGQSATLMVPELAHGLNCKDFYSQIRISRGDGDRYQAVWFDFRDYIDPPGAHAIPHSIVLTPGGLSQIQQSFGYRLHHQEGIFSADICSAFDFPGFLLLNILELDIQGFEPVLLKDFPNIIPILELGPKESQVIQKDITRELKSFEVDQALRRKTEDLHSFAESMKATRVQRCISHGNRRYFQTATEELVSSTKLLLTYAHRRDQEKEQRVTLHNRMVQARQASSLSALTYCAVVFLPLSLSASFLGMETRAKELGMLVFDFFGIAIILVGIAAAAYIVSRVISRYRRYFVEDQLRWRQWPIPIPAVIRMYGVFGPLAWLAGIIYFCVWLPKDRMQVAPVLWVGGAFLWFPLVVLLVSHASALVTRAGQGTGASIFRSAENVRDSRQGVGKGAGDATAQV